MWEQVLSNGVIQSHSGLSVLTGVSPYNGLAIVSTDLTPRNPTHLQSHSITQQYAMCDLVRQLRDTVRDTIMPAWFPLLLPSLRWTYGCDGSH
jgi:hypothetical protein